MKIMVCLISNILLPESQRIRGGVEDEDHGLSHQRSACTKLVNCS